MSPAIIYSMRDFFRHLWDVILMLTLLIVGSVILYYAGEWIALAFIIYLVYTTFFKK